jgi:queuine tRNA-ribosyltransferase
LNKTTRVDVRQINDIQHTCTPGSRRAERIIDFRGQYAQGGLSEKLRAKSLEFVQSQPVDGIAIGGLSVGETRSEMHQMLDFLAPRYDAARPRYLMGVGHPIDFAYGIERGIDMMDCVLPTRNARHGLAFLSQSENLNLKNQQYETDTQPIDPACDCYACEAGFSRGFLRHQFKVNEPLAGSLASIHNLRYLARLAEQYCVDK